MTSPQLRIIAATTLDVAYVSSCIDEVWASLKLETAVLKGVAYDGAGSSGGTHSDPTAAAALAPKGARHDLARLEEALKTMRAAAQEAARICSNHRAGDPTQLRRDLARLAAQGEPGCDLHARVGVWVPVYRTGTVAGRLPEPRKLCRACYEFTGRLDRPPTKRELAIEKKTGKLRPVAA